MLCIFAIENFWGGLQHVASLKEFAMCFMVRVSSLSNTFTKAKIERVMWGGTAVRFGQSFIEALYMHMQGVCACMSTCMGPLTCQYDQSVSGIWQYM